MKKKSKLKYIALPLLSILILLFFIDSGRATYTDQITIDCEREGSYTLLLDLEKYDIYYANSDTKHFLFINSTESFSGKTITLKAQDLTQDLTPEEVETSFLHSLHNTSLLEFEILRSVSGNQIELEVESDNIGLSLTPASQTAPEIIPLPIEEEDEEKEKPHFGLGDLVIDVINLYEETPWMWALTALIIIIGVVGFWRLTEKPYVHVQHFKKYKSEYIGRFIREEQSPEMLGYWKPFYKCSKKEGIRPFYTKMDFKLMNVYMFNSFCYIHQYFPAIIHLKVKLPPMLQFIEQVRKETKWNTLKYYLFRIICVFIPSGRVAEAFYNRIEFVDNYEVEIKKREVERKFRKGKRKTKIIEYKEYKKDQNGNLIPIKVKEIDVLQHEYVMMRFTDVADTRYWKIVLDPMKGKVIQQITEERVPLHKLQTLRSDPDIIIGPIPEGIPLDDDSEVRPEKCDIEILKHYKIPESIINMKEAIQEKHSIDNIISLFDLESAIKDKKIQDLYLENHGLRSTLRTMQNEKVADIEKALTSMREQQLFNEQDLAQIIGRAIGLRSLSINQLNVITTVITEHFNKKLFEREQQKYLDLKNTELEQSANQQASQEMFSYLKELKKERSNVIEIKELKDNIQIQ